RHVQWWRVTAAEPVDAAGTPRLVMRAPFLYGVEAWAPGAATPTRHALYGPDAGPRHSHRALVIDLPAGIPAGEAAWLRGQGRATEPAPRLLPPVAQVRRDELDYVGGGSMAFTAVALRAILGPAFWGGTGERSYAYFSAMLVCAIGYRAAITGDLRWVPGLD